MSSVTKPWCKHAKIGNKAKTAKGKKKKIIPSPSPFCVGGSHLVKKYNRQNIAKLLLGSGPVHFYSVSFFLWLCCMSCCSYTFSVMSFLTSSSLHQGQVDPAPTTSLVSTFPPTFYLGDRSVALGGVPFILGLCRADTHPFI